MRPALLIRLLLLTLPLYGLAAASAAVQASSQQKKTVTAKTPPVAAVKPATVGPLSAVIGSGPNQSGYVHYWLITSPEGDDEMQVGIELPDQRIAWSFPGLGVHISPFISEGEVDANGRIFKVQHFYGLRPFANDTAMRTLRSSLLRRVMPLVRNSVPYCELNGVTPGLCMSCMGFVSQVLFPGRTPEFANFPGNFTHIDGESYHTTEDLLLYMTGLPALTGDAARKRRMDAIGGPPALQEEMARLMARLAEQQGEPALAKAPAKRRAAAAKSAAKRPG